MREAVSTGHSWTGSRLPTFASSSNARLAGRSWVPSGPLDRRAQIHGASKQRVSVNTSKDRRTAPCKVFAVADSGPGAALGVAWRKSSSLLHSRHDKEIFKLAVPALISILLDPIMSLTDTGLLLLPSAALSSYLCVFLLVPLSMFLSSWCSV